jgi:hypothetical protein
VKEPIEFKVLVRWLYTPRQETRTTQGRRVTWGVRWLKKGQVGFSGAGQLRRFVNGQGILWPAVLRRETLISSFHLQPTSNDTTELISWNSNASSSLFFHTQADEHLTKNYEQKFNRRVFSSDNQRSHHIHFNEKTNHTFNPVVTHHDIKQAWHDLQPLLPCKKLICPKSQSCAFAHIIKKKKKKKTTNEQTKNVRRAIEFCRVLLQFAREVESPKTNAWIGELNPRKNKR